MTDTSCPLPLPVKSKILILFICLLASCQPSRQEKQVALYNSYCASCHVAPDIRDLPKNVWAEKILPEMGARLGIRENGYSPYKGLSLSEEYQIIHSGVYPEKPIIPPDDWQMLKEYVLQEAPDSLLPIQRQVEMKKLQLFRPHPLAIDSVHESMFSYMGLYGPDPTLFLGDIAGQLFSYNFKNKKTNAIGRFGQGITDYSPSDSSSYITSVGYLNPSEISAGRIFRFEHGHVDVLPGVLHRPVHTTVHDFDGDGTEELVVSEFGDLNGAISLFSRKKDGSFEKRILLQQPGAIRTLARDMNGDGRDDLLVLTSQGDESITILYQKDGLEFEPEKVIRFSPLYGTSWFDTMDYDGDGDLDLVTANGDNADKSFINKPYHGMRIYINDGDAKFHEAYFFPFYGATRVIASDFDQDGDIDFSLISTFPDYGHRPVQSFAYLENKDAANFDFQPYTLDLADQGRWFLMDSGDIDKDGDEDLVLSSFTYYFTPVPEDLKIKWLETNTDVMILENTLKNPSE